MLLQNATAIRKLKNISMPSCCEACTMEPLCLRFVWHPRAPGFVPACFLYGAEDGVVTKNHRGFIVGSNASRPGPVPACSTDFDCGLNGDCIETAEAEARCDCDPGWVGSACQFPDFLPLANASESGLPLPKGVMSVWGGSIVEDPNISGRWHMYAAMMVERCPLSAWKLNSVIVHATANNPIGPYRVRDEVMKQFA